ncbi:DUF3800 domain-containing protein [Dyella flagellata]|uniref:DUF3800 domain-containing protein n=1 Tax=Dyella flagellata TaxID=1867833 RepID=A0ABQ5X9C1_9GAMM|nr:DUF3800 domain-containing protein [Dyella flagellata]GLQ87867.1 hypothetical protein GCM10007898_14350 [Dyella flagellata]
MSWLLFLDESGHDHKNCPYEVRGGIAIHASKLWPFVKQLLNAEVNAFGANLREYSKELKGAKLLDRDRFKWARQSERMPDNARRKHARAFLTKGLEKKPPSRDEFTAYGQASIEMARSVFESLRNNGALVFASIVPRTIKKPASFEADEYLRKDHVFLLERFFYFLESKKEHGLLVFDAVDKGADQKFVRQMERYFTKTATGLYRSNWIVPVPLFVASEMSLAVQAADLAIYCINWGFRLPTLGLDEPVREEIAEQFGPWLRELQYQQHVTTNGGRQFDSYGITFVPNPYGDGDRQA